MPNPGFTLAEDAALKSRLSHLFVSDDKEPVREAKVFFRWPSDETEKNYPFITIDLIDIVPASDRQESERFYYYTDDSTRRNIDYYPSEKSPSDMADSLGTNAYLRTDQLVPVDLIYQVTTNTRSQRHDRQLTMLILRRVFPIRRGFIDVPEDGTIRRCDLLDYQPANVLDKEVGYKKRDFRTVYTVRINAEIPQSDLLGLHEVADVVGTLSDYDPSATVPLANEISEEF